MGVTHIYATDLKSISSGGISNYIDVLIKDQVDRGIDACLVGVTGETQDVVGKWMTCQGKGRTFRFLPVYRTKKNHIVYKGGIPLTLTFIISLWLNKRKILSQNQILHIHRFELAIPFLIAKKKMPIVLTIHGAGRHVELARTHILFNKRWIRWLYYTVESFVVKRADKIILVSREGMDYYSAKFPYKKDRLVYIPTLVDTEIFKPLDRAQLRAAFHIPLNEKVILFAGRFDYQKGLDLLIEAFYRLKRDFPDARLLLAGDGNEKHGLQKKVEELKIAGIEFMGMVGHGKLSEIMNCADLFVMTSLWEGMPLVVLEALACGISVVSTNVGQINTLVKDGVTGYLVNKRDPEEVKDKIVLALAKAKEMKQKCVETASMFSSPVIARQIENVYEEVAGKNSR